MATKAKKVTRKQVATSAPLLEPASRPGSAQKIRAEALLGRVLPVLDSFAEAKTLRCRLSVLDSEHAEPHTDDSKESFMSFVHSHKACLCGLPKGMEPSGPPIPPAMTETWKTEAEDEARQLREALAAHGGSESHPAPKVAPPDSEDEFKALLNAHGIHTVEWGSRSYNNVKSLLATLKDGKGILRKKGESLYLELHMATLVLPEPRTEAESDRIQRRSIVDLAGAEHLAGHERYLIETHQTLVDNRMRARFQSPITTIRLGHGESCYDAARRLLVEELDETRSNDRRIRQSVANHKYVCTCAHTSHKVTVRDLPSPDYPTLPTRIFLHHVAAYHGSLPTRAFCTPSRKAGDVSVRYWDWFDEPLWLRTMASAWEDKNTTGQASKGDAAAVLQASAGSVEIDWDVEGEALDRSTENFVLTTLFPSWAKLGVKILAGGFSGSLVVIVKGHDVQGNLQTPCVAKLDRWEAISDEYQNFKLIAADLGDNSPAVLSTSLHILPDVCAKAGLRFELAGACWNDPKFMDNVKINTYKDTFLQQSQLQDDGAGMDSLHFGDIRAVIKEVFGDIMVESTFNKSVKKRGNLFAEYEIAESVSRYIFDEAPEAKKKKRPMNPSVLEEIRKGGLVELFQRFREHVTLQSVGEGDHYYGVCHGDLNGANILIDFYEVIWLIDFATTGHMHIMKDLCKLESCVLLEYINTSGSDTSYEDAMELIACLASMDDLSTPVPPLHAIPTLPSNVAGAAPSLGIRIAWAAIIEIRHHISRFCKDVTSPLEYALPFLYFSLKALSFRETSMEYKRLAIHACRCFATKILSILNPEALSEDEKSLVQCRSGFRASSSNDVDNEAVSALEVDLEEQQKKYLSFVQMKFGRIVDPIGGQVLNVWENCVPIKVLQAREQDEMMSQNRAVDDIKMEDDENSVDAVTILLPFKKWEEENEFLADRDEQFPGAAWHEFEYVMTDNAGDASDGPTPVTMACEGIKRGPPVDVNLRYEEVQTAPAAKKSKAKKSGGPTRSSYTREVRTGPEKLVAGGFIPCLHTASGHSASSYVRCKSCRMVFHDVECFVRSHSADPKEFDDEAMDDRRLQEAHEENHTKGYLNGGVYSSAGHEIIVNSPYVFDAGEPVKELEQKLKRTRACPCGAPASEFLKYASHTAQFDQLAKHCSQSFCDVIIAPADHMFVCKCCQLVFHSSRCLVQSHVCLPPGPVPIPDDSPYLRLSDLLDEPRLPVEENKFWLMPSLPDDNKYVVLGPAASGKSVLLKRLLVQSAMTQTLGGATIVPYLVILVDLARLVEKLGLRSSDDLIDHYLLDKHGKYSSRYAYLSHARKRKQLYIMMDGLDETGFARATIEDYIGTHLYGEGLPLLISSRHAGFDRNKYRSWKFVLIRPLTQDLRLSLYKARFGDDGFYEFSNSLQAMDENLISMTGTPLLFSLYCLVYRLQQEEGLGRAEIDRGMLYRVGIELMLKNLDAAKFRGKKKVGAEELGSQEWEEHVHFLSALAFDRHCNDVESRDIMRPHIAALESKLRKGAMVNPGLNTSNVAAVWERLEAGVRSGRVPLLTCVEDNVQRDLAIYRFSHLTFQEYLAAKVAVMRIKEIMSMGSREEARKEFLKSFTNNDKEPYNMLYHAWYRQMVALTAAILPDDAFRWFFCHLSSIQDSRVVYESLPLVGEEKLRANPSFNLSFVLNTSEDAVVLSPRLNYGNMLSMKPSAEDNPTQGTVDDEEGTDDIPQEVRDMMKLKFPKRVIVPNQDLAARVRENGLKDIYSEMRDDGSPVALFQSNPVVLSLMCTSGTSHIDVSAVVEDRVKDRRRGYNDEEEGLAVLITSVGPTTMESLKFFGLGGKMTLPIALSVMSRIDSNLTTLHMCAGGLPDDDGTCMEFADSLRQNSTITDLDISNSSVSGNGLLAIVSAIGTKIRKLNISKTVQSSDMMILSPICNHLEYTNVESVRLAYISALYCTGPLLATINSLASFISNSSHLKRIDLSGVRLTAEDFILALGKCNLAERLYENGGGIRILGTLLMSMEPTVPLCVLNSDPRLRYVTKESVAIQYAEIWGRSRNAYGLAANVRSAAGSFDKAFDAMKGTLDSPEQCRGLLSKVKKLRASHHPEFDVLGRMKGSDPVDFYRIGLLDLWTIVLVYVCEVHFGDQAWVSISREVYAEAVHVFHRLSMASLLGYTCLSWWLFELRQDKTSVDYALAVRHLITKGSLCAMLYKGSSRRDGELSSKWVMIFFSAQYHVIKHFKSTGSKNELKKAHPEIWKCMILDLSTSLYIGEFEDGAIHEMKMFFKVAPSDEEGESPSESPLDEMAASIRSESENPLRVLRVKTATRLHLESMVEFVATAAAGLNEYLFELRGASPDDLMRNAVDFLRAVLMYTSYLNFAFMMGIVEHVKKACGGNALFHETRDFGYNMPQAPPLPQVDEAHLGDRMGVMNLLHGATWVRASLFHLLSRVDSPARAFYHKFMIGLGLDGKNVARDPFMELVFENLVEMDLCIGKHGAVTSLDNLADMDITSDDNTVDNLSIIKLIIGSEDDPAGRPLNERYTKLKMEAFLGHLESDDMVNDPFMRWWLNLMPSEGGEEGKVAKAMAVAPADPLRLVFYEMGAMQLYEDGYFLHFMGATEGHKEINEIFIKLIQAIALEPKEQFAVCDSYSRDERMEVVAYLSSQMLLSGGFLKEQAGILEKASVIPDDEPIWNMTFYELLHIGAEAIDSFEVSDQKLTALIESSGLRTLLDVAWRLHEYGSIVQYPSLRLALDAYSLEVQAKTNPRPKDTDFSGMDSSALALVAQAAVSKCIEEILEPLELGGIVRAIMTNDGDAIDKVLHEAGLCERAGEIAGKQADKFMGGEPLDPLTAPELEAVNRLGPLLLVMKFVEKALDHGRDHSLPFGSLS